MIRTLRAFFLSRLLREKLLLVGFIVLAVLMWLSSFSRRAGTFWHEQRVTSIDLAEQKQWLSNRTTIEAAEQKAAANLDPARTLSLTSLYAEVQRLAREAGLTPPGLGETRDDPGAVFSVHSVLVTLNKAEWTPLLKFYQSLQDRSPYIGIESFALTPDRGSNTTQTVILRVSSIEIAK